jgi:hypothetical protein
MFTKVSKRGYGFALVSLLLFSGLYSAPSQAQQPFICSSSIGPGTPDTVLGGFPWDGTVHRWGCVGIEVETVRIIQATCPSTSCVKMWYQIRARRQTIPGGTVVSAQAFDAPTRVCNLNPATTAWTAWCTARFYPSNGGPPPASIQMLGISVAARP